MATARELLAQADALMRRNRLADAAAAPPAALPVEVALPVDLALPVEFAPSDFPVLTDAVADGIEPLAAVPEGRAESMPPVAASSLAEVGAPLPAPATAADDVPMLTDVIEDFESTSIRGLPESPADEAQWSRFDDDVIVTRPASPSLVDVPAATPEDVPALAPVDAPSPGEPLPTVAAQAPVLLPEDPPWLTPIPDLPASGVAAAASAIAATGYATTRAADGTYEAVPAAATVVAATAGAETAPAAHDPDDAARWAALAEEIRIQVLQRIDIFTDTGLQEQLAARLQPIVDRASADLVATINQQVGQLLRAYVAEAIEREIERWRENAG